MLLWTLGCTYLFKLVFSFSLGIYPGVGLLDHMIALFLVFWGTSILSSTVTAPIYIPTIRVQGFPFLHILANIWWYLWSFSFFFFLFFLPLCASCGISVPQPGIESGPQQWRHWILITRLPGNSPICGLFDDGHSDRFEVISHCSFDLHFPGVSSVEHLSMCLLAIYSYVLFGEMSIRVFCPFFNLVVCFFDVELYELFIYFGY